MPAFKCKMCGGNLNITTGMTVTECPFCGTKQTVPHMDDEKKTQLYTRANKLRFTCEFDKAAVIYENIISDSPEEAEAYWGLILCKYGIEYVDDPATGKKIPTCHRTSFDSVFDDDNFELIMENSDAQSKTVYREEAKTIENIRKGIIAVSSKEEPYDIFICYKETDENGSRTVDSEIAQDVYDKLTEEGYRVFFSRISLEDKLGEEYEPYIFAALNSARIMLAFGTKYEYFNAVWVKNEWSRFLKLAARDHSKYLIPCYRDIDAYDMPKEFAKLQSQDMGKVGATQDLLRGIKKILSDKKPKASETMKFQETISSDETESDESGINPEATETGTFNLTRGKRLAFAAIFILFICAAIGIGIMSSKNNPRSKNILYSSAEYISSVTESAETVTRLLSTTARKETTAKTTNQLSTAAPETTTETFTVIEETTYETTYAQTKSPSSYGGKTVYESQAGGIRIVLPYGTTQSERGWYITPDYGHIYINTDIYSVESNAYDLALNHYQPLYGRNSDPYQLTLAGKTFWCRNFKNTMRYQIDAFYMIGHSSLIINFYHDTVRSYEEMQDLLRQYVQPY